MAASPPPSSKSRNLPVIVGLIGVSVVVILGGAACWLFLRQVFAEPRVTSTATATHSTLSLPTASAPMLTSGPPSPQEIIFVAEEPLKGFSDCDAFGINGVVKKSNSDPLPGVQIVVWEKQAGLLALNDTDAAGNYQIKIKEPPIQRKLWVQVYKDDVPVSQPVVVETQIDCRNGFQIYQIDWQRVSE